MIVGHYAIESLAVAIPRGISCDAPGLWLEDLDPL